MTDKQPSVADGGYDTVHGVATFGWTDGGLRDVCTIATTEYRLAVKNRWAIALTAIFAAFSLGLLTFSGSSVGPDGFERVIGSLAVLAVYLVPLAALAFGYDAIVGAEDSGWLAALFALPITRGRLAIGTYVGRSIALTGSILIGFSLAGILLVRDFGLAGWNGFLAFLLGTVGLGLVFLAIALLISTVAAAKTHALGAALLIWAWFVLVHDLLALGLISAFELPEFALEAMVLTNPAGIFRVLVLGALDAGGDAGFATIMANTGLSTALLIIAMLAWIVIPIALASSMLGRRRI